MAPELEEDLVRASARMPWLWVAALITLGGVALVGGFVPDSLFTLLAVFAVAAVLELVGGVGIFRREGAGLSPLFSGASAALVALFLFASWWVVPQSRATSMLAMLFGVYCLSSGITRALDLVIDEPASPFTQAVCTVASLLVGTLALATWETAPLPFVARLIGVELVATGWALAGAAWALWEHPDEPGYREPLPH